MDKTTELNDSIDSFLKELHILKKARTEAYGHFHNSDVNILRCIAKYEKKYDFSPTALLISKQLGITQATITPMIDRMVKNNQVKRMVSPRDKRAKFLTMTEEGQEILDQTNEKERKQIEMLISYLGEEDTGESIRLLQKVTRYLGKSEELE